jgi:hypothetical protein
MQGIILKNSKIFGAIVKFISVNVVGNLFIFKRPAEFMFKNNYMFKHISLSVSSWVRGYKNFFITLFDNKGFFFVLEIAFLRAIFCGAFSFLAHSNFSTTIFAIFYRGFMNAFHGLTITFMRTKFRHRRRTAINNFAALPTLNF